MLLVRLGKDASSITTVNSLTAGLLPGGHSEKSLDRSPRKGQLLATKVTRERNAAECLWGHEASTAAPWAANSIQKWPKFRLENFRVVSMCVDRRKRLGWAVGPRVAATS